MAKYDMTKHFRFSEADSERLENYCSTAGLTGSEAVRGLIPPRHQLEAIMELKKTNDRLLNASFLNALMWFAEDKMLEIMFSDKETPIHKIQLEGYIKSSNLSSLFLVFCKAKQGEKDFYFEKVDLDGKEAFFVRGNLS